MKPEKAIEILSNPPTWLKRNAAIDYLDAAKLGVEALKRCKYLEEHTDRWAGVLLPGETMD
ncbi:hypothetical protein ES703_49734 [subsurface metagenome]